ncbi:MAG: thioredoxin domain-containing protein [Deltaproteobacteria bacterium]|nr:thioredoxin domain-containing protein [Deltaproteobacteria bacterium]
MSDELSHKFSKLSRFGVPLVCLVGVGFATASLLNHIELMYGLKSGPSFCNISDRVNCDAVSASKYSTPFGIPLDAFGLAFYVGVFILALVSLKDRLLPRRTFWDVLLVLSALSSALSVVLLYISEFLVGALCILCLGMHIANFSLLMLALAFGPSGGFFTRISRGVATLALTPKFVVFAPAGLRLKRWSLSFLIAVLSYVILASPPLVAMMIANSGTNRAQFEEVVKAAIADWSKQVPVDITLNSEGVNRDYTRGPEFAPLQLVEFSDFECPHCRHLYLAIEELLKEYGDKVHFVFRNFPLDRACNPAMDMEMHRNACSAAVYARCAGEQGKFWPAIDYLFQLPEIDEQKSKEEVDAAILRTTQVLNLDEQAIQECLQSGRQLTRIQQDIAEGERLGVAGTPSVWLNGRKVKVAHGAILKEMFDKILASAPIDKK